MRKNNHAFRLPQRQSQYAIIFIVIKFLRRLIAQLWPIILAILLGRSGSSRYDWIEVAAGGIGVFGMISSIIAYFKYYYHVSDSELIIQRGILKKVKLNIPFERIQSINFKRSFLHQLLNVTEVEIETAGSNKKELSIDALGIGTAENLRKILLEKKAMSSGTENVMEEMEQEERSEMILTLSFNDLLKVGLTQNHFKPIGLLMGFVGAVFGYSFTFDIDPREIINFVRSQGSAYSYIQYVVVGILLIPLSIAYSIVTTILNHYQLQFWRQGNKFQVVRGLLTKKEFAARDNKIQILSWGQNPFQRMIGLFYLQFKQARSGDQNEKSAQFRIPGCDEDKVGFVKKAWLRKVEKFDELSKVSIHYFLYMARNQSIFFALLVLAIYQSNIPYLVIIISIIWAASIFLRWKAYTKKKYGFNGRELYIGGGTIGFSHSILPAHKIQNLKITQNPYQWRRKLASLNVYTAAGAIRIPFINIVHAENLLDEFTYAVETSQKSWM